MKPKSPITRIIAWAAVLVTASAVVGRGEPPRKVFNVGEVKAVFLINFCRFATWKEASRDSAEPFVISVVNDDAFAEILSTAARGEKIGGRPLEVRALTGFEECRNTQLVFVPTTSENDFRSWSKKMDPRCLLVGDSAEFCRDGGHIQFVQVNGKLRFNVNLSALSHAEVVLNSSLLRLADQVTP